MLDSSLPTWHPQTGIHRGGWWGDFIVSMSHNPHPPALCGQEQEGREYNITHRQAWICLQIADELIAPDTALHTVLLAVAEGSFDLLDGLVEIRIYRDARIELGMRLAWG